MLLQYIESICKKMIPVETLGANSGACLLDVLVHKILANKFKNGVLEEHVELPRFKAYMK